MSEDRYLTIVERVLWGAVARGGVVQVGDAPRWTARYAGKLQEEQLHGRTLNALQGLVHTGLVLRPGEGTPFHQDHPVFYQINPDWAVCAVCGMVLEAGRTMNGWRRVPTHFNPDNDLDDQTCCGSLRGVGE